MGLLEEVIDWCSCSISEKAVLRPYHCASYCLRPSALVSGSAKVASSVQSWSFFRVGLPANNWCTHQYCSSFFMISDTIWIVISVES
jgi:hypothetical protein